MPKVELNDVQQSARDLETIKTEENKRESSKKFKFNRQGIIRKRHLDIGQKYIYGQKIGEGSFGQVFKVTHKQLNLMRALKIIKKNKSELSTHNTYEELEILKKLDHPNVLKVYEYFQTDTQWLIVTQYFEGKELFDEIIAEKKLTQRKAALIFAQICKAVAYIHAHSIVHRDIKPENVLVKAHKSKLPSNQGEEYEYEIKLIDWGLGSTQVKQMMRKCGTPQYCAPQVLQGSYGYECDLWSLGVLLYVMLIGRFPFKGETIQQTLFLVNRGNLTFKSKEWESISIEAKYLISCLIKKNPKSRMKATQILKSEWTLYHLQKSQEWKSQRQITIQQKLLEQTLIRLKQVTIDNKFQAVVINFIHNYITNEEKERRLKEQFELLDENKDGVLSYEELLKGYEKIYSHLSRQKIQEIVFEIFKNIDLDGSGSIEYSEFITFATKISTKFSEKQLREVFSLLDEDGNGRIDKKQINQILLYERGSQSQEFDEILNEIDLDKDGSISEEQFINSINNAVAKVINKNKSNSNGKNKNNFSQPSQQVEQKRMTRQATKDKEGENKPRNDDSKEKEIETTRTKTDLQRNSNKLRQKQDSKTSSLEKNKEDNKASKPKTRRKSKEDGKKASKSKQSKGKKESKEDNQNIKKRQFI